jgi:hypothetical protein
LFDAEFFFLQKPPIPFFPRQTHGRYLRTTGGRAAPASLGRTGSHDGRRRRDAVVVRAHGEADVTVDHREEVEIAKKTIQMV